MVIWEGSPEKVVATVRKITLNAGSDLIVNVPTIVIEKEGLREIKHDPKGVIANKI